MELNNAFFPDDEIEDDLSDVYEHEILESPVSQIFCDVLEGMGFMFAESIEPRELPQNIESATCAIICYDGESSGKLELIVEKNLARELAAGLLGIEPDDPAADTEASDALGELMNVTMGQLLTELYGKEPVFSLQPPEVLPEIPVEAWQKLQGDPDATGYMIDDRPAMMIYKKVA